MNTRKKRALVAAKKARTHIEKVIGMLEADHYCIDVLQQALAIQGLWKGAIRNILLNHIETCVSDALTSKDEIRRERTFKELEKVMELADR
ncbi:metal-sensing transcriptional repressor [Candidatus Uhrbacteria bacterium]|nr:metal-sensing transcriptional repressor [Candidatus Uhrbacteria bacterium]